MSTFAEIAQKARGLGVGTLGYSTEVVMDIVARETGLVIAELAEAMARMEEQRHHPPAHTPPAHTLQELRDYLRDQTLLAQFPKPDTEEFIELFFEYVALRLRKDGAP